MVVTPWKPPGTHQMASEPIHQQYLEINHSPLQSRKQSRSLLNRVEACCYQVLLDGGSSGVEMPIAEVKGSVTGAVLKQKPKLRDSR